ncbi:MAG TPA: trehalose-6-phosphate synthase [Candidatus Paceibacterota bacterium]|nr:trehalose-6-phosphate synthase [Candidatus Paceibacterota bacterium]
MQRMYLIAGSGFAALMVLLLAFAYTQATSERADLVSDLQYRTRVLSDSLEESIKPSFEQQATTSVQKTINHIAENERIAGIAVYDNTGAIVARSVAFVPGLVSTSSVSGVMDSAVSVGVVTRVATSTTYVYISPLADANSNVIGALLVAQNAQYIDDSVAYIWETNIEKILAVMLVLGGMLVLLFRFVFRSSLARVTTALGAIRRGEMQEEAFDQRGIFAPVTAELFKVNKSLRQARYSASEEARMRLEKLDSPWTAQRLQEFMKAYFKNKQIFIVSNREPYVHKKTKKGVAYSVPAHGMVTAIDALMQACGGMWIAYGSGDADRTVVDENDTIMVPPEEPRYALKRIWLTDEEVQGHYVGFSNEALFPLCLMTHTRPVFRPADWAAYRRVNAKFAEALLAEIRHIEQPLVLVQDLHFALVPRIIKRSRPDAQVALFWHHPWPTAEQFSICPWRKEILEGMLGADLIGFHVQQHCNLFLETVGKEIESKIDFEHFSITSGGHTSYVKPFPISIPFTNSNNAPKQAAPAEKPFAEYGVRTDLVALGVDRLDYTKGIVERLRGIEQFFILYPEYRKRLTFVQIAAPSREAVQRYRQYGVEVEQEVERINESLQSASWKPIVFVRRHLSHQELRPLYRAAQVCLVTSLHDGMNLVAKEYIAEHESSGVLILSAFTGAARELTSALIINPYSPEEIAAALKHALEMPLSEQYRRMRALRGIVSNYNVYRWAMELIKTLAQAAAS